VQEIAHWSSVVRSPVSPPVAFGRLPLASRPAHIPTPEIPDQAEWMLGSTTAGTRVRDPAAPTGRRDELDREMTPSHDKPPIPILGECMQFQLLGPLEIIDNGRPLTVNGSRQRAALGFLLLHVNCVVATSRLLKALWPLGMPNTGRKMLQNAISGLRGIISPSECDSDSPALLTHAPGYLLRAPSNCVDLNRFRTMVHNGQADMAAGSWQRAARTLHDALALWRGPVLADLVELGMDWTELTAVRNSRLAALEDYVEAEFACGRYSEVTNKLETWVAAEPLRERLCGQLMRAHYHCGRQADALGVYRLTRTRLIEELGLDPGRELQELERAILNQELVLKPPRYPFRSAPTAIEAEPHHVLTVSTRDVKPPSGEYVAETAPAQTEQAQTESAESTTVRLPESACSDVARTSGYAAAEIKRVSVVLVMTRVDREVDYAGPEDVDMVSRHVAATVRAEAAHLDGIIGGTIGPLWLALFGSTRSREDDAARSVRAAMAIRDRLRSREPLSSDSTPLTVTVAVTTGDALVRRREDNGHEPPMVTGTVLDQCLRLLMQVPPNEVRACIETRLASDSVIAYDDVHDPVKGSLATAVLPRREEPRLATPFVSRDRELDMLLGALDQVSRRSRPHLVTVLGEPGIGKSRLVAEFEQAVTGGAGSTPFVIGRTPHFRGHGALAALADGVKSYAGVCDLDPIGRIEGKLADAVTRLVGVGARSIWMLSHLRALLGLGGTGGDQNISRESFPAWRQFLEEASREGPLVLVVEDLHLAENLLLDFIDYITVNTGSFPLLVVVTARTELLDRRPAWGGGKAGANTITLDPLSDDHAAQLLASLGGQPVTDVFRAVISRIDGNPLFAVEYARMLREEISDEFGKLSDTVLPVPQLVQRVVASRLDSLPAEAKAALVDAAVLRENVCAAGVVAVRGRAAEEVSGVLEYLERHDLLTRARRPDLSPASYEFRHTLIRDVAYLTIPQAVRADKHQRAAAWLELSCGQNSDLLAYHHSSSLIASRAPAQRTVLEMTPCSK
jgi:DNA-binding SARP family transcriptional activator